MKWLHRHTWHAGAATLTATAWLAGVWVVDSTRASASAGLLTTMMVIALGVVYLLGRARGRAGALFLVGVFAAVTGLWIWSAPVGLAAVVIVAVSGIESARPHWTAGSSAGGGLLLLAEGAAVATIALLAVPQLAVTLRLAWVGATWLTFGLALLGTAAAMGASGAADSSCRRLLGFAGLLISLQVGAHGYAAWLPLPPGPPAWVQPATGLMILLAMLALAAAELRGGGTRQSG